MLSNIEIGQLLSKHHFCSKHTTRQNHAQKNKKKIIMLYFLKLLEIQILLKLQIRKNREHQSNQGKIHLAFWRNGQPLGH
jgi:hypothetical protein